MFRPMRRKNQQLPDAAALEMLTTCTCGVLAVSGDEGYPYAVPLSFVYHAGCLYFHCALQGHKLDGIRRDERVSFCVIERDQVVPETFSTHYRSAVAFGRARVLTGDSERRRALELLAEKYSPGFIAAGQREIESSWNRVCVVEVKIEHLTAKAARALVEEQIPPEP